MSVSTSEFWDLLAESQLLSAAELEKHHQRFQTLKGADRNGGPQLLAEWLVSEGVVSRYQADVLRGGRGGPFRYHEFVIHNRPRSGRLAAMFQALHAPTGCEVALCFLSGPLAQDKARWKLAAEQAEIARRMAHPCLHRVYDLFDLVNYKFVVVEPLAGQSLDEMLAGGQRLPEQEACRIARCVALGLDHLHRAGQAHGEVRPQNIWIAPGGRVLLLQAPLARELDQPAGKLTTAAGDARQLELADYLAPEFAPEGGASPLGDVYALGCTLYQMLTGRPPFAGGSLADKMRRHATEPIQPLEPLGVPQPLAQSVTYMMAKDAKMRFQKASLVVDALTGYVEPGSREPLAAAPSPARDAMEGELARQRAELRSAQRQIEKLPDIDGRFGRAPGPASSTVADDAAFIATAGRDESTSAIDHIELDAPSGVARRRGENDAAEPIDNKQTKQLLSYFAAAVVLVVGGIVLLNQFGSGDTPSQPPVAVADASPTTTSPKTTTPRAKRPTPNRPSTTERPPSTSPRPAATNPARPAQTASGGPRESQIADDGRTLWASPTSGPPLDLRYLPPGGQVFVAVRPASLLVHPEGEKLRTAAGPLGENYLQRLEKLTGFAADEIAQVIVSLQAGAEIGQLESALVVRLVNPADVASLPNRWPGAKAATHEGHQYYTVGPNAYFVPPAGEGRVIAITSATMIRDLLAMGDSPPPLDREMERMLVDTDTLRQFTLLLAPKHIFGEAQQAVFSGPLAQMKEPLVEFFGDEQIKAALVSFHVDDNFFAEVRYFGTLDTPASQLATAMHDRLKGLPRQIRRLIIGLDPTPYSEEILAEFPEMIRVLAEYTRADDENNQAVLRSYLPAVAAHNLLLGAELALAQQGGIGGPAVAAVGPKPTEAATVAEKLEKPASLSFARDTLEVSMQLLSEEIGVEIIILGSDLQLDGITKNQSFEIDLRNQPARKILEEVLLRSNPDKTATGPDDPKQKLVYTIGEQDGKEVIFVTTRAQVEKRGDKLPEAFVARP